MLDPEAAAVAAQHSIADPTPRCPGRAPGHPRRGRRDGRHSQRTAVRVEQIKRFAISPVSWELGGDEITPTMKVKLHAVTAEHADVTEALHAAAGQPDEQDRGSDRHPDPAISPAPARKDLR